MSFQLDSERRPECAQILRPFKVECKVSELLWLSLQSAVFEAARHVRPDPRQLEKSDYVAYTYVQVISKVTLDSKEATVEKISFVSFTAMCSNIWARAMERCFQLKDSEGRGTFAFSHPDASKAFHAHLRAITSLFTKERVGQLIAALFPPFTRNGAFDQAAAHAQASITLLGHMLAFSNKFFRGTDVLNSDYITLLFRNLVATGGSRAQSQNTVISYMLNKDTWDVPTHSRAYHAEDEHQKRFHVDAQELNTMVSDTERREAISKVYGPEEVEKIKKERDNLLNKGACFDLE